MSQKTARAGKERQIGEIGLGGDRHLVATLINREKIDFRLFLKTSRYSGPTKSGVRFYLFDGIWEEFKKLIEKVDKEVKELE